jgi:hypothetical protein
MLAQLVMIVIMVAMNGRLLDRSVHALNPVSNTGQALAIGPRMPWLGESVIKSQSKSATFQFLPILPISKEAPDS